MKRACFKGVIRFLVLSLILATSVSAQETPGLPVTQEEINKQLLKRLQDLEEEVKQLKAEAKANPASGMATPAATDAAALTTAVAAAAAPPPAEIPPVNEVAPRLHLDVFGDVGAQGYTHIPDTFLFGSLDLFMTAQLSDKVSVLGETLFIAQAGNNVQVDVERLFLRYRRSPYLTATIGRYHTWVGYYNSTYNKAAFLETTTDRPFIYAFDDVGGVLPMQDIGVNLTGKIPSGKMRLNYVIEAGNGRAWGLDTQPAQNNQDQNNSKSINGGLFMRPQKLSGLQLGFSLRHDNLTLPSPAIGETIGTAHGVFNNGTYEILNEGVLVRHAQSNGRIFETSAFYTQFSRGYKSFRPYFRYQYFNAPSDDPVYAYAGHNVYTPSSVTTFVGRMNGPSFGFRYNFTENSAFKLQYDRYSFRGLPSENGLSSQVAFSF